MICAHLLIQVQWPESNWFNRKNNYRGCVPSKGLRSKGRRPNNANYASNPFVVRRWEYGGGAGGWLRMAKVASSANTGQICGEKSVNFSRGGQMGTEWPPWEKIWRRDDRMRRPRQCHEAWVTYLGEVPFGLVPSSQSVDHYWSIISKIIDQNTSTANLR